MRRVAGREASDHCVPDRHRALDSKARHLSAPRGTSHDHRRPRHLCLLDRSVAPGSDPSETGAVAGAIFPALIDFGEVPIGGISAAETLTFQNTQNRALQVLKVLITGHAPAAFRARHSDTTVPPGAIFEMHVAFKPDVKGARFADLTLQFTDGSAAGPAQLSGYGG